MQKEVTIVQNIGILVGSLSQKSYSLKIANYLRAKTNSAQLYQLNYGMLPLYNPDLEQNPPLEWRVFREIVDKMAALVIVTPEYNFSIPGGLKNAIDVLSVPSPLPHIYRKPALVITDSSGARGGANANAHIQQLLRYTGMDVANNFITVGNVQKIFNDQDKLIDQVTATLLTNSLEQFIESLGK